MREAIGIVNNDWRAAAARRISDANSTLSLDYGDRAVFGPELRWIVAPEAAMKFARFMVTNGMLREPPASWCDYFFP